MTLKLAGKMAGGARHLPFRILIAVLVTVGIVIGASPASAQINSTASGVTLNANLTTSLTVSASPGLVNFALLASGTSTGSAVINVNTSWTLRPSVGAVTTYAYFSTSTAALSDGAGDNIPSSSVSGSINGGAFGPFTGASPFAAASSVTLSSTKILGNNRTGNHTDTLNLMISTVGLALPAGTYSGVLNVQAQAL